MLFRLNGYSDNKNKVLCIGSLIIIMLGIVRARHIGAKNRTAPDCERNTKWETTLAPRNALCVHRIDEDIVPIDIQEYSTTQDKHADEFKDDDRYFVVHRGVCKRDPTGECMGPPEKHRSHTSTYKDGITYEYIEEDEDTREVDEYILDTPVPYVRYHGLRVNPAVVADRYGAGEIIIRDHKKPKLHKKHRRE